MIPAPVRQKALELASAAEGLPSYVYDLAGLQDHAETISDAFSDLSAEVFYAAKANPDPELLRTVEPYVDGFEVASGGELEHVHRVLPYERLGFGGPGKTECELASAVQLGVERIHVESPLELARLIKVSAGTRVGVLLRANLDLSVAGAVLSMNGPFGMDETGLRSCADLLRAAPWVHARGVHVHLASGLGAAAKLELDEQILAWARPWMRANLPGRERPEINLGGGMAVDYARPENRFDWASYAHGLARLADPAEVQLRIEPGRAVTVYSGYYVTDVLDLKWTRGQAFAVLRGGTHHLRTPAAKGHSQPFTVVHRSGSGPEMTSESATLVGQLCTPKDILAQGVMVDQLRVGDLVVFEMAGAYAWSISHHDFLMHPKPGVHYLN